MAIQRSYQETTEWGALYLVPTPIGNLEDMTFRAVDVLKTADLILAEDTRHTQKLLNHFAIMTPQKSFHKFNTQERIPEVIAWLKAGQTIAEVSDAGMPVISDPGQALVMACVAEGIAVIPLPGANAALTGLVASGLSADTFTFVGFLPRQSKERRHVLTQYQNQGETLMFYESPHRLKDALVDCAAVFGPERQACVVRELTKQYEEFNRDTLQGLIAYYQENKTVKGEICFLVAGNPNPQTEAEQLNDNLQDLSLKEQVEWWMAHDQIKPKPAIKKVAKLNGLAKQAVYMAYHEIEGR
ncbi:MAG: 16S rRNA (cytidine(1402)-2'-O)-methyltransferase [Aerococcus sp.]|nr:16S rRNA (cytidine(1402)-2'-O)-methyltransferase [Aerococcus sp.]